MREIDARLEGIARALTFDDEVRTSTDTINRLCARSANKTHFFFGCHVSGIKNLVYSKAIDMALLYNAIRSAHRDTRLRALERLRDEANNYQGLEMPYNTRRILIALMKETVKARGDLRQQHRYIAAFNQTLSGRAYVVRTMLDELGLAEVPEASRRGPGARAAGWDDHVYDNAGPGRKTPAQLVLDAYIKGLSRITIVYEDLMEEEPVREALEAGRIMGIEVGIGVECIVQTGERERIYHILLLDCCDEAEKVASLFRCADFRRLEKLLERDYAEYDRAYCELLEAFNSKALASVNKGFEGGEGALAPLSIKALKEYANGRHLFHVHLGRFLFQRISRIREARKRVDPGDEICELSAADLRRRFFDPLYSEILPRCDFLKAARLYTQVSEMNAGRSAPQVRVAYSRILGGEIGTCVRHLLANPRDIHAIEVWNNRIVVEGKAQKARFLESLRRSLNSGDAVGAAALLEEASIGGIPPDVLKDVVRHYSASPLQSRIVSASDGYNHLAPGMGFAPLHLVRNWRQVMSTNRSSPLPLLLSSPRRVLGAAGERILPLGKERARPGHVGRLRGALARLAERVAAALRLMRDLNAGIRNAGRMLGGAMLAVAIGELLSLASGFPFSFGAFAFFAWFGITYSRNFIVDMSARHGLHPSRWRLSSFDSTNAANSVFFTFQSIALLRFVEQLLDHFVFSGLAASLHLSDIQLRLVRFIPLALVNGTYIYSHNTLRGFTKGAKRANFWRSALAFPLAVGLSYLNRWPSLIPGALVNKVASDIIGGFTEVTFKILKESRRARQMYEALLPVIAGHADSKSARYAQRLAILDTLYVWGNTPRGKEALRKAVDASPDRMAIWARLADPVRRYEKYVTLITKKTSWRKPGRIKLEFLRLSAAFSYWLERNSPRR